MKISKLIIPLLGLTSINNNNQANAIQIEKELSLNMPYEVVVRDNWDNYLTNANLTENIACFQQNKNQDNFVTAIITQSEFQNILASNGKKPPIHQLNGCDDLFRSIMNTCDGLTGGKKKACIGAAWASYWICMAGGR